MSIVSISMNSYRTATLRDAPAHIYSVISGLPEQNLQNHENSIVRHRLWPSTTFGKAALCRARVEAPWAASAHEFESTINTFQTPCSIVDPAWSKWLARLHWDRVTPGSIPGGAWYWFWSHSPFCTLAPLKVFGFEVRAFTVFLDAPAPLLVDVYREYPEGIPVFSSSAQTSAHFFVFESYRANLASFSARVILLTHWAPIIGSEAPTLLWTWLSKCPFSWLFIGSVAMTRNLPGLSQSSQLISKFWNATVQKWRPFRARVQLWHWAPTFGISVCSITAHLSAQSPR